MIKKSPKINKKIKKSDKKYESSDSEISEYLYDDNIQEDSSDEAVSDGEYIQE